MLAVRSVSSVLGVEFCFPGLCFFSSVGLLSQVSIQQPSKLPAPL